jgi:DNA-binding GntR family transcriptional regulator
MSAESASEIRLKISKPDPASLSDQIYRSLRHALMQREFTPGTRMVETMLSEQLGVSRTPVREALNRLTVEGWLESRPNKGVVVAGISPQEIRERYSLREVLEGYGARLATERISDEELDHLEEICNRAERALDDNRGAELAHLDGELHEGFLSAAGNESLLAIWRQYLHPARHSLFALGTKDHRRYLIEQHRRILAAMRRRDPDAAEQATREHLHYAMQAYLSDSDGTE